MKTIHVCTMEFLTVAAQAKGMIHMLGYGKMTSSTEERMSQLKEQLGP